MSKINLPVLLLTGYLGSGKTTLLNRILSNKRGIRFAVIVNDIGEVNIDASLIQKGGIVDQQDDSPVALQNGCICCTLKMDLVQQIQDIIEMQRFDYLVIEASGICEPAPIAQTICSMQAMAEPVTRYGIPELDCIVTDEQAHRRGRHREPGHSANRVLQHHPAQQGKRGGQARTGTHTANYQSITTQSRNHRVRLWQCGPGPSPAYRFLRFQSGGHLGSMD